MVVRATRPRASTQLSCSRATRRSPRWRRALVATCTTTIRGLPSEVLLEPGDGPIDRPRAVNLDSVESVSIAVLVVRLGRLSDQRMGQICAALEIALDCQP